MNILQFADGLKRTICRDELATSLMPNIADGISKITNLTFSIYDDTHMIDVLTFDTYISPGQLRFEEQTLDKITKIKVFPVSAVQNIKELRNTYTIDNISKRVVPIEESRNMPLPNAPVPFHHGNGNMLMNRNGTQIPVPVMTGLHGQRRFGMRSMFM
jgi:hypothetical protein